MPRFQGENFQKNLELAGAIQAIAKEKNCTSAQLAIAWLLSRKPPLVPLAGSSKRKWLEENAKAADITPSATTLAALDKAFAPGVTRGERYAAPMMARLGL